MILSLHRATALCAFGLVVTFGRASFAQTAPADEGDDLIVPSTNAPAPAASSPAPAAPAPSGAVSPSTSAAPASTPAAPSSASNEELQKRIARLEEEVKANAESSTLAAKIAEWTAPYKVTGFIQSEYQTSQASEDQLAQGGTPLNRDRFVLRRARVRVEGDYKYAGLQLELDGNTIRSPSLRVLHAFGTLKWPGKDPSVPLAAATMGLFDTPFGYELVEWPRTRWFMDRSTASLAFFSDTPDLGVKFHGGISFLRWDIALMNGEPLESRTGFPGLSPQSAKQLVMRVGFDTKPREDLGISGHVSTLRGKGFHRGSDATKGAVQWKDANEDGAIQPIELSGIPATGATPSQTFDRWAVSADLQARLRTKWGTSTLYGEITVANNLDRTLFVADPTLVGTNTRELGFYVGFVQEVMRYGVVGFRWDRYDPNSDFFDKRGGKLIPTSMAIDTFSPLVGLVLPDPKGLDRARLLLQYDFVRDNLARDSRGLPTDLKNDVLTLRLQVSL